MLKLDKLARLIELGNKNAIYIVEISEASDPCENSRPVKLVSWMKVWSSYIILWCTEKLLLLHLTYSNGNGNVLWAPIWADNFPIDGELVFVVVKFNQISWCRIYNPQGILVSIKIGFEIFWYVHTSNLYQKFFSVFRILFSSVWTVQKSIPNLSTFVAS